MNGGGSSGPGGPAGDDERKIPFWRQIQTARAAGPSSRLAASASSHAAFIGRVVSDLKSRSELDRHRAARDLYTHISTDLRELNDPEELNAFLDAFTKNILDLVKSADASSKLGGILAIVALINADACNTGDRISRFGNYLRDGAGDLGCDLGVDRFRFKKPLALEIFNFTMVEISIFL